MKNERATLASPFWNRLRNSALLQFCVLVAAAALVFVGMSIWGVLSDCGPHDFDGFCGYSSMMMKEYGGVLAVGIVVLGGVRIEIARRHRQRGELDSRSERSSSAVR